MSPRHAAWVFVAGVALAGCASAGAPRPSPFPEPASKPNIYPAPLDPKVNSFSTSTFLAAAQQLRGVPYQLGGDSPKTGFDCSGYTKYVFGLYRIQLPRTVIEQFRAGKPAGTVIRPGDLLFFRMAGPKSPVSHVALALSAEEFIHSPGADGVVRSEKLSSPYWRSRFVAARRIL
ncbi:MAG: peptidoglycan endopeptidase [Acidobacteria bacterium]|nr:MAG: peptidoglycan endopeptidase [Acidobacteriota bacterium]